MVLPFQDCHPFKNGAHSQQLDWQWHDSAMQHYEAKYHSPLTTSKPFVLATLSSTFRIGLDHNSQDMGSICQIAMPFSNFYASFS